MTTNFILTSDENTFSANECQRKVMYLLMVLNVDTNTYVSVQPSLHANEGHIIVNERMLTIIKQSWTCMNGYFL